MADSGASWDAGVFAITSIDFSIDDTTMSYGALFAVDHDTGDAVVRDLAARDIGGRNIGASGTLQAAGLASLNGGIAVDTNKFTVEDATGNTVIGGTADLKGQVTIEKSSILGIGTLLNVGGDVDIDADLSDFFEFDWSADATINEPTNLRSGRRFMLRIRTIGTSGHTLTWDPIFVWQGTSPSAPVIDETVEGYWYVGFVYNEHNNRLHSVGNLVGPYLSA